MPRTPSRTKAAEAMVEPTTVGRAMGEVAFYRQHNAGFGPYLRKLREDRGMSLRDAAAPRSRRTRRPRRRRRPTRARTWDTPGMSRVL